MVVEPIQAESAEPEKVDVYPGYPNAHDTVRPGSHLRGRETLEERRRDAEMTAAMREAHGRLCVRCTRCGRCKPKKKRLPTESELASIRKKYARI